MKCVFCENEIKWHEDYSAFPVCEGYCCYKCFDKEVNPKRFSSLGGDYGGKED